MILPIDRVTSYIIIISGIFFFSSEKPSPPTWFSTVRQKRSRANLNPRHQPLLFFSYAPRSMTAHCVLIMRVRPALSSSTLKRNDAGTIIHTGGTRVARVLLYCLRRMRRAREDILALCARCDAHLHRRVLVKTDVIHRQGSLIYCAIASFFQRGNLLVLGLE